MESPHAIWHVSEDGEETGPFSEVDLRTFISQGRLTAAALIWRAGMPAWVSITTLIPPQISIPPQSYNPIPHSSPPLRRGRPRGFFAGYKYCVGTRSFIFQCIVIGWSAMIGLWMVAGTISAAGSMARHEKGYPEDPAIREARHAGAALGMGAGWCCMAGVWAAIAVPCGIAAIATMEGNQ